MNSCIFLFYEDCFCSFYQLYIKCVYLKKLLNIYAIISIILIKNSLAFIANTTYRIFYIFI